MENSTKLDGEIMIQYIMLRFNQTREQAFASLPQGLKDTLTNTKEA